MRRTQRKSSKIVVAGALILWMNTKIINTGKNFYKAWQRTTSGNIS